MLKKTILLTCILSNLAFGYIYDKLVVATQASVFTKIITLDKNINSKLINGKVKIIILHEKDDHHNAQVYKDNIISVYADKVEDYGLEVELVTFKELNNDTEATAIISMIAQKDNIDKISQYSIDKKILTFAYEISDLSHGIIASIVIEKKTKIFFNKSRLKKSGIDLGQNFLMMVRFWDEKNK